MLFCTRIFLWNYIIFSLGYFSLYIIFSLGYFSLLIRCGYVFCFWKEDFFFFFSLSSLLFFFFFLHFFTFFHHYPSHQIRFSRVGNLILYYARSIKCKLISRFNFHFGNFTTRKKHFSHLLLFILNFNFNFELKFILLLIYLSFLFIFFLKVNCAIHI